MALVISSRGLPCPGPRPRTLLAHAVWSASVTTGQLALRPAMQAQPPFPHIDGVTGAVLDAQATGEGSAQAVFAQLQLLLSSAHVAGLAGRIVVSIGDGVVAVLSISVLWIWSRKRSYLWPAKPHRANILKVQANPALQIQNRVWPAGHSAFASAAGRFNLVGRPRIAMAGRMRTHRPARPAAAFALNPAMRRQATFTRNSSCPRSF